jgi:hypothetical protein
MNILEQALAALRAADRGARARKSGNGVEPFLGDPSLGDGHPALRDRNFPLSFLRLLTKR